MKKLFKGTPAMRMRASASQTFEEWMKSNFPEFDVAKLDDDQKKRFETLYQADEGDDEDPEDDDAELEAEGDDEPDGDEEDAKKAKAEAARAAKRRARANRNRRPGDDGASSDGLIERMRAEQLRMDKINRLCAARDTDPEIAKIWHRAVKKGEDVRDVELAVMRASRAQPSQAAHDDGSNLDVLSETIQAALLMNTASMSASRLKEYGFSERAGNEACSKKWRGASLRTVCDFLAHRAGCRAGAMESTESQMAAARESTVRLKAAGFTQLTLNYILENVQGKVLLDAYQSVQTIYQLFCTPTSNPDFKIYGRYALDNQSVFQKVGSQGQLAELKMGDRRYTTELETYGGRFGVDRKTWINDDLGAINARIAQIGIISAKTIDLNANLALLNGINNAAMFHSSNGNYLQNSTANYSLDVAGLTNVRTAFSNQVGPDKQPLGVELDTLMHGIPLQPKANAIFTSQYLNQEISANVTVKGQPSANPFYNMFKPNENKFLSNKAIKDANGNALPNQDDGLWFLLGKQGNNAPFYIAFLNGQQSPTILTEANTAAVLGFEMVVFIDFAIGYGDPRLAVCANPNGNLS